MFGVTEGRIERFKKTGQRIEKDERSGRGEGIIKQWYAQRGSINAI